MLGHANLIRLSLKLFSLTFEKVAHERDIARVEHPLHLRQRETDGLHLPNGIEHGALLVRVIAIPRVRIYPIRLEQTLLLI